jgi:hypothetical protein
MKAKVQLQHIVQSELKGLCNSCAYATRCVYTRASVRTIIQCEFYDRSVDREAFTTGKEPVLVKGLCAICDKVLLCKLPAREQGVWHCNDFE